MHTLTLRFDGSYQGTCGGAGAIIKAGDAVVWQGARYIARCASSAAAEYEGLLLGLDAVHMCTDPVAGLHVEGDCRVVLRQAAGLARARKLGKFHRRSVSAIERLETLAHPPSFDLIDRGLNRHADALSRAAVDASCELYGAAVLVAAQAQQRNLSLRHLAKANAEGIPLSVETFERLLQLCHKAEDWPALMEVYRESQWRAGTAKSPAALSLAIGALEAMHLQSGDVATRQRLAYLRRRQKATQVSVASQARRELTVQSRGGGSSSSASTSAPISTSSASTAPAELFSAVRASRDAAAECWWRHVDDKARGLLLLGLDSVPPGTTAESPGESWLGLADRLSSVKGLAVSGSRLLDSGGGWRVEI